VGNELARDMQETSSAETEVSTILGNMGRQVERQYAETDGPYAPLTSSLRSSTRFTRLSKARPPASRRAARASSR
jgi:hypothetical protein